ncbi:MAG TPA: putative lipid II flippase FtsW [Acidimicrobiales bacterium]|nr:putative lipid II flippase FtsW [Acidimicrobiales bacterium]
MASPQRRLPRPAPARVPGAPRLRVITGGAGAPRPSAHAPATTRTPAAGDARRITALAALLTAFGLVMVLSASPVVSIVDYGSAWSLFERQLLWSVLGVLGFALARRVDLARLRRLAVPLLVGTTLLLLAVLAPGIGRSAGGSSRWIGAGFVRIQPSELAKLAFVLFAADLVCRRAGARDELREIVRPLALVLAFLGVLILKQPDMGTAIVLVCICGLVLFAGGVRTRLLVGGLGLVALAGGALALAAPYRRARLLSFVNPFAHATTTGYQVVQSLAALGSGHLTGAGFAGSATTYGLLPNAQTDFIFAVVGNELGLLGAVGVVLAFLAFGWVGLRIAAHAPDRFSALVAVGVTGWIVCQALINIGGVTGILPETGIPLPFLSFGGSSLVVVLVASGLLANVARARATQEEGAP